MNSDTGADSIKNIEGQTELSAFDRVNFQKQDDGCYLERFVF